MEIKKIERSSRELGRSQGFRPLPVRDDFEYVDDTKQFVFHCMVTAWEPTPDEMDRLKQGAPIYLSIMSGVFPASALVDDIIAISNFPPVLLSVGDIPE